MNENEDKKQYCDDFCPIYASIREYNNTHENKIFCTTDMCKNVTEAYEANRGLQTYM